MTKLSDHMITIVSLIWFCLASLLMFVLQENPEQGLEDTREVMEVGVESWRNESAGFEMRYKALQRLFWRAYSKDIFFLTHHKDS